MKAIAEPYYLRHADGPFVAVVGGSLTLTGDPRANSPAFTAENMGPARADDFHKSCHAAAYKRYPLKLSRYPVRLVFNPAQP
jgi:hypothetical protein